MTFYRELEELIQLRTSSKK